MIKYPIEFIASGSSSAGIASTWSNQLSGFTVQAAIPPEFSGPGGGLSPEDLYNSALANCFVGTFKVLAENSRLSYSEIRLQSKLVVDLDENKKPVMKDFYLSVSIVGPSNPDKALLLAKKASENGFILNSVKTKCHFSFEVG